MHIVRRYTHMYTQTRALTRTHARTRKHTLTHASPHNNAHTLIYTHTNTHASIHVPSQTHTNRCRSTGGKATYTQYAFTLCTCTTCLLPRESTCPPRRPTSWQRVRAEWKIVYTFCTYIVQIVHYIYIHVYMYIEIVHYMGVDISSPPRHH